LKQAGGIEHMEQGMLEFIVRSNQAELYRYVKYLGADSATAEDVVQVAFLAAFRSKKVPDLENVQVRGAWLRSIARNTFLNYCRKKKRSPVVADSGAMEEAERFWSTEFLGEGDGFDYLNALSGCVDRLAEKTKTLIQMRYTERKSRAELAVFFEMTEDGIKSLLRRVKRALGKCVGQALDLEWKDEQPEEPEFS